MVKFLQENHDVFASTAVDMSGIDPQLITHWFNIDPIRKHVQQKKKSFAYDRYKTITTTMTLEFFTWTSVNVDSPSHIIYNALEEFSS